jgi:DNA-binding CsgD family transcriptional regulator
MPRSTTVSDAEMPTQPGDAMTGVLATVGVGKDAERLYRAVLRTAGRPLETHGEQLGWPIGRARAALTPLLAVQLVAEDPDGALVADHPRATLSRLIDRSMVRLDQRRRELEDVRSAVSDFAADHLAGTAAIAGPVALDPISPELVVTTVEEMIRSTTGVLRSFHLDVALGPATDSGVTRAVREQMAAGRELRSVYPLAVLDHPEQLAWVREWAAVGERQRVVKQVPHEFVVFGDEAVLSSPGWGSTEGGAVLMRLPLLVQAFTTVFDDAWRSGLPVPDPSVEKDADTRLLALLAGGFKDEAIARYLGLSLRTVRRRVAALAEELGVHTRFQLGVVAQRRGLLDDRLPRRVR